METLFESRVSRLHKRVNKLIRTYSKAVPVAEHLIVTMPEDFRKEFFALADYVNLRLMEDKDNFYGYFLFQTAREIRFDIGSATAINFSGARYVIYYNPLIFLTLTLPQMESSVKHEILHVLSMHLTRAREFMNTHHKSAINIAMDLVVNRYLDDLPPYSVTLEGINARYSLNLEPYKPFEYYADKLQAVAALHEVTKDTEEGRNLDNSILTDYNPEKTHDLWEASDPMDEKTLREFTEKVVGLSAKGEIPAYIQNLIASLKNSKGELPWNLYLNRLMGTVESRLKKTVTRRNRRQPERLELRGQLRDHKANIAVAVDISGSISEEEFKQALKEVLNIVKNYKHEITVLECDDAIRRVYKVVSIKDMKDRTNTRGGTRFNPVFEYANLNAVNLLVYFTDGKGEEHLKTIPRGYQVLWVLSGRGEKLSLKEPYGAVKKLSQVEIKDDLVDALDVPTGGFSMQNHERNI